MTPTDAAKLMRTCPEHDGIHVRDRYLRGWVCLICGREFGQNLPRPERSR